MCASGNVIYGRVVDLVGMVRGSWGAGVGVPVGLTVGVPVGVPVDATVV